MKISFCTTCANRAYQLRRTFPANLAAVSLDSAVEWVILNYGSADDLDGFIRSRLPNCVERVVYARDTSGRPWHLSVAKNIAHRIASGDVLFNLDCDNFIDNATAVVRRYFSAGCRVLHSWSGAFPDGTCGRIAIERTTFYKLGGYDEAFHPMGYQDLDLLERARAMHIPVLDHRTRNPVSIRNSKEDSVRHCATRGITWRDYDRMNRKQSARNIAEGRFVANASAPWRPLEVEIARGHRHHSESNVSYSMTS